MSLIKESDSYLIFIREHLLQSVVQTIQTQTAPTGSSLSLQQIAGYGIAGLSALGGLQSGGFF
jgi:hypothetical protein